MRFLALATAHAVFFMLAWPLALAATAVTIIVLFDLQAPGVACLSCGMVIFGVIVGFLMWKASACTSLLTFVMTVFVLRQKPHLSHFSRMAVGLAVGALVGTLIGLLLTSPWLQQWFGLGDLQALHPEARALVNTRFWSRGMPYVAFTAPAAICGALATVILGRYLTVSSSGPVAGGAPLADNRPLN